MVRTMDVMRFLMMLMSLFVFADGALAAEANRRLQPTDTLDLSAAEADGRVAVLLAGAVERPGSVVLDAVQATVGRAIAAAGGASRDSYRFATLLLRRTGANADAAECLPVMARLAGLLIQDDPKLGSRTDLVSQLASGQLISLDPRDTVAATPGVAPLLLQDGDLLALPSRSSVVYMATAQGAIVRLRHEPAAPAERYIEQLPKADRRGIDEFILHYPNGQQTELAIDAWRYRPTMIPPGALIAPDSVCLRRD